jgi:hypothetical protein
VTTANDPQIYILGIRLCIMLSINSLPKNGHNRATAHSETHKPEYRTLTQHRKNQQGNSMCSLCMRSANSGGNSLNYCSRCWKTALQFNSYCPRCVMPTYWRYSPYEICSPCVRDVMYRLEPLWNLNREVYIQQFKETLLHVLPYHDEHIVDLILKYTFQ